MTKDYQMTPITERIQSAIRNNWDLPALTDLGGATYSFREVGEWIAKFHLLCERAGVKPGDKIALCGKNSSNWAVSFLTCLAGGYVAVPILHEFKADVVHHLVNHSDSKLLFVDKQIWQNLEHEEMKTLEGVFDLGDFALLECRNHHLSKGVEHIGKLFGEAYPKGFGKDDVVYKPENPEDLAVINYTSGSTGSSKGVMLPYRSIESNITFCIEKLTFMKPGDGVVCMLPLAHMYGMVIDLLHIFVKGCHANFLMRLPSPKVLLGAFAEVRPKLVITVPLVVEKIIKGKIFPMLATAKMKVLLALPVVKKKVLAKLREGLINAFGGQLRELIIGGAPLNPEVEEFLRKCGFPYTVGYGMTECGPLISYAPPGTNPFRTVGRIVDRMEMKVDSPDPRKIPGNLWVRGAQTMLGYYHNDEATREAMPENDDWMNTGDLCCIDDKGNIAIFGRSKTMILGPSGQNIYPEEIEHKLDNLPYVCECLVVERDGKLVALVYPDPEAVEKDGLDAEAVRKIMDENLKTLNSEVPGYSRVSALEVMEEEFEKTPKRSIKRYLYQQK